MCSTTRTSRASSDRATSGDATRSLTATLTAINPHRQPIPSCRIAPPERDNCPLRPWQTARPRLRIRRLGVRISPGAQDTEPPIRHRERMGIWQAAAPGPRRARGLEGRHHPSADRYDEHGETLGPCGSQFRQYGARIRVPGSDRHHPLPRGQRALLKQVLQGSRAGADHLRRPGVHTGCHRCQRRGRVVVVPWTRDREDDGRHPC
jgi:hypothetical protein